MTELEVTSLLLKLADTGITGMGIYYEGSGDSGAVDKITYTNTPCETAEDVEGAIGDIWGAMGVDGLDKDDELKIEHFAYTILEDVEDWYNNEGGFGSIYIHVPSGEYIISNNVRIVDIETYAHEGNLMDKTKDQ